MTRLASRLRAASPAMGVALLGSLLSVFVTIYARSKLSEDPSRNDYTAYGRIVMADAGITFVIRVMVIAGLLAAATMAMRHARTLLWLAAGTLALLTVERTFGWQLLPLIAEPTDRNFELLGYVDKALGGAAFLGVIGVVVAAVRTPGMAVFAVPALIGAIVLANLPFVGDAVQRALDGHRWVGLAVSTLSELAWIVGLAGLTGAIMHDHRPVSDPRVAVTGLKRVERGLLVKAVMPIAIFIATIVGLRNGNALKLVVLGGLAATMVAWLSIGAGAITLVRSRLEGLSPSRLLVGAGLAIWWAVVYFQQAMYLYESLFRDSMGFGDERLGQAWIVAGPMVAAAGFVLLGWSVSTFAKARGDEELATSAIARTVAVVTIDVSLVLVTNYLLVRQAETALVVAAFGVLGSIIGTLSFAKLFLKTAEMVESSPALPMAALVSKGES